MATAEKASKKVDLSGYVSRTAAGTIDVQATHVRFTQDIAELVSLEKQDSEVIGQAVEKVFTARQTSHMGMNQLLHFAMENLDVTDQEFPVIRERVASYVRSNKDAFKVSKGKGGGVEWLNAPAAASPASTPAGSIRPRQTHA